MSDTNGKNSDLTPAGANKPESKKTVPAKKSKPGLSARLRTWGREMRSELKKVVWPTPKQLVNNSTIVVVSVLLVGGLVAVYDLGAQLLITWIIGAFAGGGA